MAVKLTALEAAAWGGLIRVQARMFRTLEDQLQARHRLSHAEYEVLMRLSWRKDGQMRLNQLAAQSILSPSGMSRVIDRLEAQGLIRRQHASDDKRGYFAALTAPGRERFVKAQKDHLALVRAEFLGRFDEDELRTLARYWGRFAENAPAEEDEYKSD